MNLSINKGNNRRYFQLENLLPGNFRSDCRQPRTIKKRVSVRIVMDDTPKIATPGIINISGRIQGASSLAPRGIERARLVFEAGELLLESYEIIGLAISP